MALQFILGRSGSGKTSFCLEKIKNHSGKSIIIVPEQASLSMEKLATEKIGYLGASCQVLSFNRLFHALYKKQNGKKRNYIDKTGKIIIINRLIFNNKEKLTVFKNADKYPSVSSQLMKTFSEFKRHGVTPDILENSFSGMTNKTLAKFKDLTLIYKEYINEIEKTGSDSDDNLEILKTLAGDKSLVGNYTFYIDGFSGFTTSEINVIKALAENSENVFITLCCDEENPYLFSPAIDTKAKLLSLIDKGLIGDSIYLSGNKKHNKELKFLEENYSSFNNKTYTEKTENVLLFGCENPSTEADMCGWYIYNLTKNNYCKFGDIAVISSKPDIYNNLLAHSFKKYDIDFYKDEKLTISKLPVSNLFICLLNVCISNFSTEDVISLIKTGFLNLTQSDALYFEKYLIKSGVKGSFWNTDDNWSFLENSFDLTRINSVKDSVKNTVMPFKNALSGGKTADTFASAFYEFAKNISLSEKTEEIAMSLKKDGYMEKSVAFIQGTEVIFGIFRQLGSCMGDTKFTFKKYKDMLLSAFAGHQFASVPVSQDRVIIGNYEDSKLYNIKVLIVLGANMGSLPPAQTGTGIITDEERRYFENSNISLAPDNKKKALSSPFSIYSCLTIPSDRLVLSYSDITNDGRPVSPSEVVSDLKELFDNITVINSMSRTVRDLITTPTAALCALAGTNNAPEEKAVLNWFEKNEGKYNRLSKIKSASYFKLTDKISEETARILWEGKLSATVTKLEQFAKCPYSFFLRYGLNLKEKETSSYQVTDAGTFMHKILECYTSFVLENNIDWAEINREKSDEISLSATKTALDELTEKFPILDRKQEFLLEKLKKAGADTAWTVVRHIQSGEMRPVATEYNLRENLTPLTMTTPKGNTLNLYGIIDRIDAFGDKFRIVDYKSGRKTLDLDKVYDGFMLQLFLYSAAMKDKFGNPTGMFYLTLNSPVMDYYDGIEDIPEDEIFYSARKMNGYMVGAEDIAEIMDREYKNSQVIDVKYVKTTDSVKGSILTPEQYNFFEKRAVENACTFGDRILTGDIPVSPSSFGLTTSCTFCPFSSVCGFETDKGSFREGTKLKKEELIELAKEADTNEQN